MRVHIVNVRRNARKSVPEAKLGTANVTVDAKKARAALMGNAKEKRVRNQLEIGG